MRKSKAQREAELRLGIKRVKHFVKHLHAAILQARIDARTFYENALTTVGNRTHFWMCMTSASERLTHEARLIAVLDALILRHGLELWYAKYTTASEVVGFPRPKIKVAIEHIMFKDPDTVKFVKRQLTESGGGRLMGWRK